MPRKIDLITELYKRTIKDITSDSVAWRAFLHSAAYQYKYPFADQVLIHAQRPFATACAETQLWNNHFGRWVNRGATGIALIEGRGNKHYLKYVFDVSDTHHRDNKPFDIWSLKTEYEGDVIEALQNRFLDEEMQIKKITEAVMLSAINLASDNITDYLYELSCTTEDSFLEELDEDNLRVRLLSTVQAGVAYSVLTRLGYTADDYVDNEMFAWVHEFNTPATVNILGNATSDITEICLREIERTVRSVERSIKSVNRTFDAEKEIGYNDTKEIINANGGKTNDVDLQDAGRRKDPESRTARADELLNREVRTDEVELYEAAPKGDLHDNTDGGQIEQLSARDRRDSESTDLRDHIPDGTEPWGNGADEVREPDEVGSDDELDQSLSRGRSVDVPNLRISDDTLPQIEDPEELIQILRHGDYLRHSKEEIVSFLSSNKNEAEKADYVKSAYPPLLFAEFYKQGTEEHLGYRADDDGLLLYLGNFPSRSAEMRMDWAFVTQLIEALISDENYLDQPEVKEGLQISLFDTSVPDEVTEIEVESLKIDNSLRQMLVPQEVIDDLLRLGGCTRCSNQRIYEYYRRAKGSEETIPYLRREYQSDNVGITVNGKNYSAKWDDDGIRISTGDRVSEYSSVLIPWEVVDKRVRELMNLGQYLSKDEAEKAKEVWSNFISDKVRTLLGDVFGDIPDDQKFWLKKSLMYYEARELFAKNMDDPEIGAYQVRELKARLPLLKEYPPRYRFWETPEQYITFLEMHLREPIDFPEADPYILPPKQFTTQDKFDSALIDRGTDTKLKIYSFFLREKDKTKRAKFLQDHFGIGGSGGGRFNDDHNSKGWVIYGGLGNRNTGMHLKWSQVAQRVDELIRKGVYLSDKDKAEMDNYEREDVAWKIKNFYNDKMLDVRYPYDVNTTTDFWVAVKDIAKQISSKERLLEIIDMMQEAFEGESPGTEDYDRDKNLLNIVKSYSEGKYNLFPGSPYRKKPPFAPEKQAVIEELAKEVSEPIAEEMPETEYNLQLGVSVHIGKDEYDILSISSEKVELFDGSIFPLEMDFETFMKRIRENPLNDDLLKEPKPPRVEYKPEMPKKAPSKNIRKSKQSTPTVDSIVEMIENEYKAWNHYNTEGGYDPFWEDGVNMNLIRNHIISYRQQIIEMTGGENLPEIMDRELPPEVLQNYVARADEIREAARKSLEIYQSNETYQWCLEQAKRIPEKLLKKSTIPNVLGYVSGLESYIEDDSLVDMRRHRNPNRYLDSFDSCKREIEKLLPQIESDLMIEDIFESLMNGEDTPEEESVTSGAERISIPMSTDIWDRYTQTKAQFPDSLALIRVGDFYEIFDQDAVEASDALELTLTGRSVPERPTRIPMCGLPYHALDKYLKILLDKGYKVVIAETDDDLTPKKQEPKSENKADEILEELKATDTSGNSFPEFVEAPKPKVTLPVYNSHPDIPDSEKHNYRISDNAIGTGGAKEKFKKNIEAIKLLHTLELEERLATPQEQDVLAQYSGWGGLADAFDETKDNWQAEFKELSDVLSEEEYKAAKESTLTAFYTPPVIINAMYKALENMGFKRGNVLEPSCGVGNFMGLIPEGMDAKVYGVELDNISGRIARQLYQKNSITIDGYENTLFPDSFFDVAIGNIPFEQFKVLDKKYDKYNFLIHDYFFAKTIDKVRPGGVIAFVTSSGTLDKENPSVRKYIAQRADLLGAIRLPDNAFSGAGTRVMTDIIFLQKRDRLIEAEPEWVHLGKDENGIVMNRYFVDNPDMIMGEMQMRSGPFGPEPTCRAYEGEELGELLEEAVDNIHAEISDIATEELTEENDGTDVLPADPNVKNYSFTVVDGKVYYRQNSIMSPVETSLTGENRIKGLIGIRDAVRELIDAQVEDYPEYEIKRLQDKLNSLYDAFTKKYGLINSRGNSIAFSDDNSYFLLCSLEILDENKELKAKADMFTKRTIKPQVTIEKVDTASEALAVSIGERARVDIEYMEQLTGKSEEELYEDLKGVIFLNPLYEEEGKNEAKCLPADEYLSGNVKEKLRIAESSAKINPESFTINVEALERVQPTDLTPTEISVQLGTTWVPQEDVEEFMYELLGTSYYGKRHIHVKFIPQLAEWLVTEKSFDSGNVKANSVYGTNRINAYEIIEQTLNLKNVQINDYVDDGHGNVKAVLNKKETAIAQGKQEQIRRAFEEWIWTDPERRERLCKLYNETFNSIRPREFDGSHIKFFGMSPEITLRKHQIDAVARIMYGGNSLLAHVVGAGKTFTMVAAAQESKRLGLCNKSMFVVPNHLIEQWASEYLQLYPSANILVATKKDFETKNRKKFCARIATGDYDAVIIGHSQFEKIPVSVERQIRTLEREQEEILYSISKLKAERGEHITVKRFEKTRKQIEAKLKKLNDQTRKDDVVTFEELGVDRLFIDEAHYYKNLAAHSKMRNVAGISQTEAQKSSDLYMKCRYLDEITGYKGIVFATGTPISNTMVEFYTLQKYLQYDVLQHNDLLHFDAWASTYGETVTAIELAPEGSGYRAKTRFARFNNIPELISMFKQAADIQTSDMLNLPVPKANYHIVKVEPSDIQRQLVESFGERAEKIHNGMVESDKDNMLLVTNDGRKAALDQRLLNPTFPDFEGSKVNKCVQNVYDIWERTAEKKSAQLIFCDLSTPKNDGNFNVYDDIRNKLIARGISSEEIAFIHNADTDTKKKELFAKVRRGQVRVLIGSTTKMGAGTNVQERLIALHDLDVPWRPSDLEQRAGRIVRQLNTNPEVDIYRYVTEGTFDAYSYQLLESKQKFISQIMTSKSPVRSAEDVDETALSYAEIKALASGNPLIMEKMQLDADVAKLKLQKASHLSQRYSLETALIRKYPSEIADTESRIKGLESDIETAKNNTLPGENGFSPMVIMGATYTEKADTGNAILDICSRITNQEPRKLGSYRGFDTDIGFDSFEREFYIKLRGELTYTVPLGKDASGIIIRLDNAIEKLGTRKLSLEAELAELHKQVENAKAQIAKPFPDEELLEEKCRRLDELNAELNLDKRENEMVDDVEEIKDNEKYDKSLIMRNRKDR